MSDARISKADAIERLEIALSMWEILHSAPTDSPDFVRWKRNTTVALRYIFGESAKHVEEFNRVSYSPMAFVVGGREPDYEACRQAGLRQAKTLLESMLEEVVEFWPDAPKALALPKGKPATNKVFVVHGHDVAMKETVCRFLESLGLAPVVLHEQPNASKTIIEKFEKFSDVPFAVVLLSGDDIGGRRGAVILKEGEGVVNKRARQNVILELGFFLGRLGRERVCPLVMKGVEIPSDYDGVVYVAFDDAGAWRLDLVKELKAAGFSVDANKAF